MKNPDFLTIFGHFCLMDFSPKNLTVTHNYIWTPKHRATFPKKLMSQFQENLQTDGRMDRRTYGRKDGQTLFYRTLPSEAGSPTTRQEFIINYLEKKIYWTNIVQNSWTFPRFFIKINKSQDFPGHSFNSRTCGKPDIYNFTATYVN